MQTSGKNSPKGHVAELKNEFPLGWTGRIRFGCYLCLSLVWVQTCKHFKKYTGCLLGEFNICAQTIVTSHCFLEAGN